MYKHIIEWCAFCFGKMNFLWHMLTSIKLCGPSLLILVLCSGSLFGKGGDGYLILPSGDTATGRVVYRRIDVPRRVVLMSQGQKVIYNPRQLTGFGLDQEYWHSVHFVKSQLGWDDDFFMKEWAQLGDVRLLYGKITSKGCGCHGVPYSVSREWVLYNVENKTSLIIERSTLKYVINEIAILAFFENSGKPLAEQRFKKIKDLLEIMSARNS